MRPGSRIEGAVETNEHILLFEPGRLDVIKKYAHSEILRPAAALSDAATNH